MTILKHLLSLGLVVSAGAFRIYEADDLNNVDESCSSALLADINCHPQIRSFVALRYRGSLENVTLTDEICVEPCSVSLRGWFNTVAEKCNVDDSDSDTIPMQLGGNIWAGWNETCIKDHKTKKYCNDIIDEFPKLGDDMPLEDLCHPCYRRRLAIMQSSQYSIYNEYYKGKLERIYRTCGGSGPTDIPLPLIPEEKEPPFCFKNKWYTTRKGDTCDSISKDKGVSGAMLYMGNQDVIDDCHKIPKGLELCIPMSCKTYYVSPLGDAKTLAAIKEEWSDQRVLSSGKTPNILPALPPKDVEVAKGTTLHCGSWHVVKKTDTCDDLCEDNNVFHRYLLYKANPSLDMKRCEESLVPGTALCVSPLSGWDAKD
ncbi:hypothetical protein BFJ69_g15352 [Fusarium oxysporum]|uniref:LysM domain-containing protein n=1 Tax=Fusarium oxysporum TaxID=5507 RepID=A0A420MEG9_FUSOX|nr:hypothetical protein BFJ69_g15352 [Fusarium oxysporum]